MPECAIYLELYNGKQEYFYIIMIIILQIKTVCGFVVAIISSV